MPRLAQAMDGWRKEDPPTKKKLPVGIDIPEYLASLGMEVEATELVKAIGDSTLIAFYYLLRVGEYTVKGNRNHTKQTVQFKLEDAMFFRRDSKGRLRQLPINATDEDIMTADGATLKLDNQKNGWKGVCVYQEHNKDEQLSPVRALGRRCVSIRHQTSSRKTYLSAYWMDGKRKNITAENISAALKFAATALDYPSLKGIPIDRVDTHSLRAGGANALSLAGYSDRDIQKMGRWRGETFKEYIREELHCFAEGMSTAMKQDFKFVNIAGGAYSELVDVTRTTVVSDYQRAAGAA